ncbi:XRE family transcriptional regulator [Humibacter ginsenosidimutans]|uniref:XRE family transcriptional regulator n=2 Tax=Humibacter ginsenosidimutans TaxID=2599293 RepID=A0A5B8M925_9MICO|nr:XRE family transcriptional regulator [Humibacter ginsenosidimutans]
MVPVDIARYRCRVTTPPSLRDLRRAAGISQRELSRRSGVAQPNIAAYETGRRAPAPETRERLMLSLTMPTVSSLREQRDSILESAAARKLTDVRVFGSVARGDARAASDIDLLVHPADDASVFDLAGFMADVEELVGRRVDVVSDRGTGPTMNRILAEAVAI